MAITYAVNPNESIDRAKHYYFGLSTDTKPTVASHAGLPEPGVGWEYIETNTGDKYITYDGTNWIPNGSISGGGGGILKKVSRTKALIGGAYSAGDVLSEATTNGTGTCWILTDVVPVNGGSGTIIAAMVESETTNITPVITAYVSNTIPTSELDDNAANTAPIHADLAYQQGVLYFEAMSENGGDAQAIPYKGLPLPFTCAAADNDLYAVMVTETVFTQGAGDDMTLIVWIER